MTAGLADSELVQRIARSIDTRAAEAELCRRFAPRIRLYGLRHLRSEDRASDLVQGVLLALSTCLTKLDPRSRTVLLLSFEAEHSADEIAQLIDSSAGNVRVVRHRALAQLRRCLDCGAGAVA